MDILLVTGETSLDSVIPSLGLLSYTVQLVPFEINEFLKVFRSQLVLIDARFDLVTARGFTRILHNNDTLHTIVLAILTEGNLVALNRDWGINDFLLTTVGPAELDARFRLWREKLHSPHSPPHVSLPESNTRIVIGELIVDERTYTARLKGELLDLTYKEFELLKYFVNNVGRVFTRAQLLQEVWGYDFFGGSRTVDVHVRRLRAKLGNDYEELIGTVRNVGYKAVKPERDNMMDVITDHSENL